MGQSCLKRLPTATVALLSLEVPSRLDARLGASQVLLGSVPKGSSPCWGMLPAPCLPLCDLHHPSPCQLWGGGWTSGESCKLRG